MELERKAAVECRFADIGAQYAALRRHAEDQVVRRRWSRSPDAEEPRPPFCAERHRFRDRPPKRINYAVEYGYDERDQVVLIRQYNPDGSTYIDSFRTHRESSTETYGFHQGPPGHALSFVLLDVQQHVYRDGRLIGWDRYTLHGTWEWEAYSYGADGLLTRIDRHWLIVDPEQVPGAGLEAGDIAHWVDIAEHDSARRLVALRRTGPLGWNNGIAWPEPD